MEPDREAKDLALVPEWDEPEDVARGVVSELAQAGIAFVRIVENENLIR